MDHRPFPQRGIAAILVAALCLTVTIPVRAQQLITPPDPAAITPSTGSGDSCQPIISPDGRFVLFGSRSHNLVTNLTSELSLARMNVFLRDRSNAATIAVSMNAQGTRLGNGDSFPVALSTNGQCVLFESSATDLVANDTNGVIDVFLRDLAAGTNCLISVGLDGRAANAASHAAVMTPDARLVAFSSAATNLVMPDTNRIADVFVRDLESGTTIVASRGATNTAARSASPQITPDGRHVAFLSSADWLVPTNLALANAVYVHDLTTETITLVNSNLYKPKFFPAPPHAFNFAISDDARFVAIQYNGLLLRCDLLTQATNTISTNAVAPSVGQNYQSLNYLKSTDMTPDGKIVVFVGWTTNSTSDSGVFVWDEATGITRLISTNLNGDPLTNAVCESPRIDPSGRWVVFLSTATNLTTNVVSGEFHCYAHDLQTGETILVDTGTDGIGTAKEFLSAPQISADGRWVAFDCTDADLAPGDHNRAYDLFVRDLMTNTCELISVREPTRPQQTRSGATLGALFDVSANGRFVAYSATGNELLPGSYTNVHPGVFVRDLLHGTNSLASADTNGLDGADGGSFEPVLSSDGRIVAFTSSASNLVSGDTNRATEVFVRNLETGGITRLTTVNGWWSYAPKLSADGRFVLFRSSAGTVTAAEYLYFRDLLRATNQSPTLSDVAAATMTPDGHFVAYGRASTGLFLWDSQLAATVYSNSTSTRISSLALSDDGNRLAFVTNAGLRLIDRAANTNWLVATNANVLVPADLFPQFSGDGRYLVYTVTGPMVGNDTNRLADVYLHDVVTRSNRLISRSRSWPGAANGKSDSPAVSPDGRFITYRSTAADIVPGDSNGQSDAFLYDLQTDTTTRLFGDFDTNLQSFAPRFSADSQNLVFGCWSMNLATADYNEAADLFSLKLYTSNATPAFACQIIVVPNPSQHLMLIWPAVSGRSYRVEFKDELANVWQNLNAAVTIVGDQAYAMDFAGNPNRRFYRVVAY